MQAAIDTACASIAPAWPLDRFIAVNPYWGHMAQPIEHTAARLAVLAGSPMLMPRAWFRDHWRAGRITRQHVQAAIDAAGSRRSVAELVAALDHEAALPPRLPLATDGVDATRDLGHAMAWRDYVTQHISQCCASYFDQGQAAYGPDRNGGLYPCWLRQSAHDHAPALLMGYRSFAARLRALPAQPLDLIHAALQALRIPDEAQADYLSALLISINGWASWCAYQRWQARLQGGDDDQIVHLLALRLAWEWLLLQAHPAVADGLRAAWGGAAQQVARAAAALHDDWLWQAALEQAWQAPLCRGLAAGAMAAAGEDGTPPAVQAVFCIAVRSEPYRRAPEAASAQRVQTLGFAGFFAMFIEYRPLGSEMVRPQLPGLLAPALCVSDVCDEPGLGQVLAQQRCRHLAWRQQWQGFAAGAGSGFSFVESCGALYAAKLARNRLGGQVASAPVEHAGITAAQRASLRPRLADDGSGPDLAQRVAMAANALGAVGLTGGLARTVLLAGHGSASANNPHAAGLDCGACGGQTGEVNARVLARLLNEPAVREGLREQGVTIGDQTVFVAGLHNTTTDQMLLYDTELLPASHAADLRSLRGWLDEAGARCRAERAASLGLAGLGPAALRRALEWRGADWAQVRPEWGLADCAAFIVAPRARSRHLNLGGRSFLHDYRWQRDPQFKVLELIMTAPMVVTNWINLQYHASTVDNRLYGSGNKLLHNVVGGHIGVFEGNGGDLRIGLPLQSLHDGERWRHTPLRLSVFIEAPRDAIDAIVARHALVHQLPAHGWLVLFHIEPGGQAIAQWRRDGWQPIDRASAQPLPLKHAA
jgi:uncharacterized protein YbcC (UPF0753/DUF2309 family)